MKPSIETIRFRDTDAIRLNGPRGASAIVSLLGFSAMVGAVGGGGLGDLGIRYGYQRFMPDVMALVVAILVVLVQSTQTFGDLIARRVNKRLRHS